MAERVPHTPTRLQVRGDYFHGVLPAGAVYIGRPAPGLPGSKWANPFKPGQPTPVTVHLGGRPWTVSPSLAGGWPPDAAAAVEWFGSLVEHTGLHDAIRAELAGRSLACWCKPTAVCHGDVLLKIANTAAGGETP